MRIEFLGSGGAITTPVFGCRCRVCTVARARGVPYSRTGPSVCVRGPDVLIDTPEEIKLQLNTSRVVMMHIEEPDGLSFDDLQALSGRLQ
jgi:phosphoribosyl 1,2-cyclic phosphate phosphodiesterase